MVAQESSYNGCPGFNICSRRNCAQVMTTTTTLKQNHPARIIFWWFHTDMEVSHKKDHCILGSVYGNPDIL